MTANAKPEKQAARTAITPTRAENFPEWYQQVIRAADMAENSPVRGCFTLKPYGYAVWENIQRDFDRLIKREGVQNAYFPLLIPLSFIAKEAEHIDGFAKECAVVTHHRLAKNAKGELAPDPESVLPEPLIVRPTSETIIGESMHNWVQSYRDLPLKLNQWCNVMRWEMRPRIFLRTAEFLWQEGHNALETHDQADADARRMLDVYREFFTDYMAVPGFAGVKTPDERFPGAIETYTIEAMMQDGKALQACTSHNLGQTFSTSADIRFLGRDGAQKLAWTTSWGMSTRTIGGLIMVHGDDDGMIFPPRIAPVQVILIPILKNDEEKASILAFCEGLQGRLQDKGLRVQIDRTDDRSPDKMWRCIKKGVPVRVEVGAREVAEGKVTYARRDLGKEGKGAMTADAFVSGVESMLSSMHKDMYQAAEKRMRASVTDVSTLAQVREFFTAEKFGAVRLNYATIKGSAEFEALRKEFSISPRCLPFEDEGRKVIVGKAY